MSSSRAIHTFVSEATQQQVSALSSVHIHPYVCGKAPVPRSFLFCCDMLFLSHVTLTIACTFKKNTIAYSSTLRHVWRVPKQERMRICIGVSERSPPDLPLRVDHKRPAAPSRHHNSIFRAEFILRKSLSERKSPATGQAGSIWVVAYAV